MRHVSCSLIAFAVIALAVSGCFRTGMNVGEKLPNLVFYDLDGNKVEIYNHIEPGKRLLLHLWGAACCLTYSVPTSRAVSTIHKSERFKEVTVVSVNLDYPIPKVRQIARELGVDHPMLNDKGSAYYDAEPKLRLFFPLAVIFVVDEKGIIQGKLVGPQLQASIEEVLEQSRQ